MHITFSVITHQYWNWPLVYIGSDIQLQIINSNSGPKFSPVFGSPPFLSRDTDQIGEGRRQVGVRSAQLLPETGVGLEFCQNRLKAQKRLKTENLFPHLGGRGRVLRGGDGRWELLRDTALCNHFFKNTIISFETRPCAIIF